MKKRKPSKISILPNPGGSQQHASPNAVTDIGCFTFPNGDRYEGEYEIRGEPLSIVRQGRGIYATDDFNKYNCVWVADRIGVNLNIRHNNGTEYMGSLDENGTMSGQGTYCFPDGSSIAAEWKQNTLLRDIRYKEPLGFNWKGKLLEDGKEVEFMAGNHFWDDMDVSENGQSEVQATIMLYR